jgi:hypothetical protein
MIQNQESTRTWHTSMNHDSVPPTLSSQQPPQHSPPPPPTMVTLVSPTLGMSSVTSERKETEETLSSSSSSATVTPIAHHPKFAMTVCYLPDPYNNISRNNNNHNNNTPSQLRPYFLLRRERPLLQTSDPNKDSVMGNITPNPPASTRSPYEEESYHLCEMTLIEDMTNSKSSNAMNDSNNNNTYQSFLISNNRNNSNNNDTSSSSYVVQDGSLYTMTPMDPLFWLLRDSYLPIPSTNTTISLTTSSSTTIIRMDIESPPPPWPKQQWQPLLQFLQEYDPVIQKCVYGKQSAQPQYKHLLNEMSMGNHTINDDDDDDSMILVQFSIEKALLWLHRKQQTVEQYLLHSASTPPPNVCSHSENGSASRHSGAFSSGFTIAKENKATAVSTNTTATNVENNDEKEQKQNEKRQQQQLHNMVKEESVQLVCNYLSPAWQDHFLQYLKIHDPDFARISTTNDIHHHQSDPNKNMNKRSKSEVETTAANGPAEATITPTVDWNMSLTTSTNDKTTTGTASSSSTAATAAKSKKLLLQPITAGAKRLLKVNQRGIQSVSSFFGVGAKNKTKK